ncbi:MAG: phosphoglycerate mutase family protein [Ruminococcus sp.]|nr:phosphoglycerate mutase family protein [Ruminococcus sp.]
MKILFLRHGSTKGNLEKRYIGTTDEPLCSEGFSQLKKLCIPRCEVLVCSPMKRCIQTVSLLFPEQEAVICNALRECDFGEFEGKNYAELSENAYYQKWVDSGGALPFPKGEAPSVFRKRCLNAFEMLTQKYRSCASIAFVVHGGTIMSVMEKYAVPRRDYFDWHCENGHGYACEWDGYSISITEKI